MSSLDPHLVTEIVSRAESTMETDGLPAWLEQSDELARLRILLALACDIEAGEMRCRVFRVKLAAHTTSPIYYIFQHKGPEDQFRTLAHYVLSYQRPSPERQWVCDSTRNTRPFMGTYRGDLGLVGSKFHEICPA